jgi:hypothetical protein
VHLFRCSGLCAANGTRRCACVCACAYACVCEQLWRVHVPDGQDVVSELPQAGQVCWARRNSGFVCVGTIRHHCQGASVLLSRRLSSSRRGLAMHAGAPAGIQLHCCHCAHRSLRGRDWCGPCGRTTTRSTCPSRPATSTAATPMYVCRAGRCIWLACQPSCTLGVAIVVVSSVASRTTAALTHLSSPRRYGTTAPALMAAVQRLRIRSVRRTRARAARTTRRARTQRCEWRCGALLCACRVSAGSALVLARALSPLAQPRGAARLPCLVACRFTVCVLSVVACVLQLQSILRQ